MNEQVSIQRILQSRFTDLKAKNPSYSVRAFSRKAGISAGSLSLILLGKRTVSKKLAEKLARNHSLDPHERSEILEKFPAKKTPSSATADSAYLQLTADQFHLVADWIYFAILNLTCTKGFKNDVPWMAGRLGLAESSVRDAIERLKRLEMLREDKQGRLTRTTSRFRTTDDIANVSLRKSHHQTLDLAKECLDTYYYPHVAARFIRG